MNINVNKVKIVVYVPNDYLDVVRNSVCSEGAGIIGNYTYCTSSIKCIGTFIPNEIAKPFIGSNNNIEYVDEFRLEVICDIDKVKNVLTKLREVHPYEEPAIDIIPLLDENDLG